MKRQAPGGYDRAFIPPFTNRTVEPGIETYFTNALAREVQQAQMAKVTSKSGSQVTISGTINSLKYLPTATAGPGLDGSNKYLPSYTVLHSSYRVLLEADVAVRRNSDDKILWQGTFRGEKSYVAPQVGADGLNTVNPLYNHSARHQNISQLASDMMAEAVDRMTENF